MAVEVRDAGAADAGALVVLRAAMYLAMGDAIGGEHEPWRAAAEAWFADALEHGDAMVVLAEDSDAGPVSCALGLVQHRAPSPSNPDGRVGHVSQVSTLPGYRRQGLARACLSALLERFDAAGIPRVDLHATGDGEALYRSLGFAPSPYPSLRRERSA